MSDLAISVRSLGKLYALGEKRAGYKTLRESLVAAFSRIRHNRNAGLAQLSAAMDSSAPADGSDAARNPARLGGPARRGGGAATPRTFWALRDVSFDVHRGEIVGIIGRNGAGKSTLLKILSRITEPTSGEVEISGRTGSLLEVGTGFHPELTGRENIFLNGAILGMKRAEIAARFDEIIAFAGTEKFLDTPVKYYSSGMYMRLAFAIAAHLEPEILIVDEVLAVGDAEFQKKCLGKMGDFSKSGRTVLFVSHNLAAVRRLCKRAIWLEAGEARIDSSANDAVSSYESAMSRGRPRDPQFAREIKWDARFIEWGIVNANGDPHSLDHLKPVTIKVTIESCRSIPNAKHGIALYNHEQHLMWARGLENVALEPGECTLCYTFPMLPIRAGMYTWLVTLYDDLREIDSWYCEPEMTVATESHQAPYDNWTGILNLPATLDAKFALANQSSRVSAR